MLPFSIDHSLVRVLASIGIAIVLACIDIDILTSFCSWDSVFEATHQLGEVLGTRHVRWFCLVALSSGWTSIRSAAKGSLEGSWGGRWTLTKCREAWSHEIWGTHLTRLWRDAAEQSRLRGWPMISTSFHSWQAWGRSQASRINSLLLASHTGGWPTRTKTSTQERAEPLLFVNETGREEVRRSNPTECIWMNVVNNIHLEYGGAGREVSRRREAAWRGHLAEQTSGCTTWLLFVVLLLRNRLLPDASRANFQGTVTEESTLSWVDYMVTFMTSPNANSTYSRVACQPTRIAVVPVLLLIFLPCAYECAFFFRSGHVPSIVCFAIVKDILLVAL